MSEQQYCAHCNWLNIENADMVVAQRERILQLEQRICRQRVELARANRRIEHEYRQSREVWDCFTRTKPARDATAGLTADELTALADAGGVARVLELLKDEYDKATDGHMARRKSDPTRDLLTKLGRME